MFDDIQKSFLDLKKTAKTMNRNASDPKLRGRRMTISAGDLSKMKL